MRALLVLQETGQLLNSRKLIKLTKNIKKKRNCDESGNNGKCNDKDSGNSDENDENTDNNDSGNSDSKESGNSDDSDDSGNGIFTNRRRTRQ